MKVDESMKIKEKSNQIKMNLIIQCTKNKEEKSFIYIMVQITIHYILLYIKYYSLLVKDEKNAIKMK